MESRRHKTLVILSPVLGGGRIVQGCSVEIASAVFLLVCFKACFLVRIF